MSEEYFGLTIKAETVEQAKSILDLYDLLKNKASDRDIISWFGKHSEQASELLKADCNSDEHQKLLMSDVPIEIPGFDLAWVTAAGIPGVSNQYWYPEWCANLCEALLPNDGITVSTKRDSYKIEFDYLHDIQAPITAVFLAKLFIAAGFKMHALEFSSEYED